nr:MotB family protein [Halioglobus japonicus]
MSSRNSGSSGAPAWMATFADLMSLMVCFFVLLLSFSQMDIVKYKKLSESMRLAFGVQRDVPAMEIPKGTSVVRREFSPGTPRPTPLPEFKQQTTDQVSRNLQLGNPDSEELSEYDVENMRPQEIDELKSILAELGEEEVLRKVLKQGIDEGKVEFDSTHNQVTIRIREHGSFASGLAVLNEDFLPLIAELRWALREVHGTISVEGHTDDVPFRGEGYDSNWELSIDRAMSVARELMRDGLLDEDRFMVVGHADTHPLKPNDSVANRAANRRVEIVIRDKKLPPIAETPGGTLELISNSVP